MSPTGETSESGDLGDFGIYVHWPFCASKCPYCDFNSHVQRGVDQDLFLARLCTELHWFAERTSGRSVSSIFFGGGTPSLMEASTLGGCLDEIARLWAFEPDIEISMEANPSSVDAGRFAGYAAAGVNRLSLGVQALNDSDLGKLGRLHSVAEALDAIGLARRYFSRVSFDLIYARPGQTMADWGDELKRALDLGPNHLSLYQLTFEEGTPFETLRRAGKIMPLDDDAAADLFDLTGSLCTQAGLPAYEISNHARAGEACRHNLIYWRMHDYIGIGPGAHGRFSDGGARLATSCLLDPKQWAETVLAEGQGLAEKTEVSASDQATEMMLMGLRLTEGVSMARYQRLAGMPLNPARLAPLKEAGLITVADNRLSATARGRPVLNTILKELLA